MAEAKLKNEEVDAYARQLLNAGILTKAEWNILWHNEVEGVRDRGEKPITSQDVADAVNQMSLNNSKMEMFQEMNAERGVAVDLPEWESVRAAMGGERPSYFDNFKNGLGYTKIGAEYLFGGIGDALGAGGTGAHEVETAGGMQTIREITRELKEQGHGDLPNTIFRNTDSIEEVMAIIMERTDITGAELDLVLSIVEEKSIVREQSEASVIEDIENNEAIDRRNEADPLYSKNMGAYEILERNSPTKYQFDRETGAIYLTDGGGQVDRHGNVVEPFSDAAAALVGGWDVAGEPNFSNEPAFDDATPAGLAFGKQTGWQQMAIEMGLQPDQVTEGMYMDVLDVINNKAMYGQDASRYLMGQDTFLGGFASTYRTDPVEETKARSDMRNRLGSDIGGISYTKFLDINDAEAYLYDMQRWTSVDQRRPSYDHNDQWAQFAGMSVENVAAVQQKMIDTGWLDKEAVADGWWGPAEAEVMKSWMITANGRGDLWTDLPDEELREQAKDLAATSQRAGFVPDAYRPLDPARVELTVKDSIRQLIGRDATAEDLQQLGGYLTDQHSASYEADVKAARGQYNARVSLDESGGQFAQPGAVQDVDFEARFITQMEERFKPQLESQERGVIAKKQQNMGVQMSNLMNFVGGS